MVLKKGLEAFSRGRVGGFNKSDQEVRGVLLPGIRARSITFLARWTHQVGALKKPPGSTWADLVANGPPISISTW